MRDKRAIHLKLFAFRFISVIFQCIIVRTHYIVFKLDWQVNKSLIYTGS